MPQTRASILKGCGKAVRSVYANGKVSEADRNNLERGHQLLFGLIRNLASETPKYRLQIERALQDVHPRTDYCIAMLIRDIADVCVTLNRLRAGGGRSVESKVVDASALCIHLGYEFRA
ncbi:hypothetical protein HYW60_02840 [Candidatus Kaiserbacteria bacterium]|nr:hypothetical protein [Candidatus Kaiserbacteria bacterium]